MKQDLKQRVEEVNRILNYERLDIQHASDLARIVYQKQDIQYVKELITDLAFELSEAEPNVEIWQNTDELSQARIKKLEGREAKLVKAFNLLLLRSQEAAERLEYLETVTEFKNFSSIQCLNRAIQHVETIKEELGIANKGEV